MEKKRSRGWGKKPLAKRSIISYYDDHKGTGGGRIVAYYVV